ncbi:putative PPC domain-containing protein [Lupinus albus]|uniref:AT-hook motif nuclear-localized protein n=1 Tax=Lupinus albus TaxID=3870 RepID=A0A6A4N700_LUPAL|nr:putative PPC domain-containing protein [Lupinus albus]
MSETRGGSFRPHVMIVNKGEDVVSKILAFCEKNVRKAAVSVVSATGAVSSVLIRNTNQTLRREGWFEVVSLSGSSYNFVADDSDNSLCKKGMFTILLSEPDGRIFGGILEGSMIAATPIQVQVNLIYVYINNHFIHTFLYKYQSIYV